MGAGVWQRDWTISGLVRRRAFKTVIATFLYLAGSICSAVTAAEQYRLGVGDVIHVRIGQWNVVEQIYDHWQGLEGEYAVGPDGTVSIALAGAVPAVGLTVHDVAKEISFRIQQQIGTPLPPVTSVEVARFRPVYVVGAVTSPGEFPYKPRITVLQAVALAGGYFRSGMGLAAILPAKLDSLNSEIDIRKRQLSSAQELLRKQSELVKSGAIPAAQLAESEHRVRDIEVSLLQLGVQVLEVKQQLNEANPAALSFMSAGQERIVTKSRDARAKRDGRPELIYLLIRTVEGRSTAAVVDENHQLLPGDTLKIILIDESAG